MFIHPAPAIRPARPPDRPVPATDPEAGPAPRSVWDARSRCRFVVATPRSEPGLWQCYLAGARDAYRRYGAERALEYARIRDGRTTALFFSACAPDGTIVGGVRVQGPYRSADDAHALVEWGAHDGAAVVRRMIEDRVPFGVVEAKGAWTADGVHRRGPLADAIGRFASYSMNLLDVQFMMATAAVHVLERWSGSGGVVADAVPAVPYPDERYRTRLMWWDRRRRRGPAEALQLARLLGLRAPLPDPGDAPTPAGTVGVS